MKTIAPTTPHEANSSVARIEYKEYFTNPKTTENMLLLVKALMILGRVTVDYIDYMLAEATDGSGMCISQVYYSEDTSTGHKKEVLMRIDTANGFATLVRLAETMSDEDYATMAANLGLNDRYWKHNNR